MTSKENLYIDPSKKAEYQQVVQQAFVDWHEQEGDTMSFEEFRTLKAVSFLACIQYLLEQATPDGTIDTKTVRADLEKRLGGNFNFYKFDNAIAFVNEGDWDELPKIRSAMAAIQSARAALNTNQSQA